MVVDSRLALAAIDCGTNSTRLLIAGVTGEQLVRRMQITRLGQGVDATHQLGSEAIERTLECLREYGRELERHGVERTRMVATSAVRDARNGRAFLEAARSIVGVEPELLPGYEEGRLAYEGAVGDLDPVAGDTVVVDIGGGSTELSLGRRDGVSVVSLQLGCVRLTERYLIDDPPTPDELAEASAATDAALSEAMRALPALGTLLPGSRVVGVAGTVSTLAMLSLGLDRYDWGRVHHATLRAEDVDRWLETLAREPSVGRAQRPAITPGREDVIVGGALILGRVLVMLHMTECLVSEADILDGLVASLREST